MKPQIIKLEPYGDHRDAKSLPYNYELDFSKIVYNLVVEDCSFILSVLFKNVLMGDDVATKNIYDTIAHYTVFERGTERWADVTMKNSEDKFKHISFCIRTDVETKMLFISTSHTNHADASATIMIYEYFNRKYRVDELLRMMRKMDDEGRLSTEEQNKLRKL